MNLNNFRVRGHPAGGSLRSGHQGALPAAPRPRKALRRVIEGIDRGEVEASGWYRERLVGACWRSILPLRPGRRRVSVVGEVSRSGSMVCGAGSQQVAGKRAATFRQLLRVGKKPRVNGSGHSERGFTNQP